MGDVAAACALEAALERKPVDAGAVPEGEGTGTTVGKGAGEDATGRAEDGEEPLPGRAEEEGLDPDPPAGPEGLDPPAAADDADETMASAEVDPLGDAETVTVGVMVV
ncbi:hypothetical protein MMC10_003492 [Thelotrema lepadinum]|nr:hypothetical protein [Thelotrema lepadinum]